MKKLKYIAGILIVIVVIIYWKEKNNLHVDFFPYWGSYNSKSMTESISDGSFVCVLYPLKSDYKLHYSDLTVKFDTAWVQHSWVEKSVGAFFVKKELTKNLFAIIPFEKSKANTFLFTLKPIGGYEGGIEEHKYETQFYNTDTLALLIMEKNPIDSRGWKKEQSGDTVMFIIAKK